MEKNIIVLEDTRRIPFGGGQKITKKFIEALSVQQKYKFFLFDDNKNIFLKKKLKNFCKEFNSYDTDLKKFNITKTIFQLFFNLNKLHQIIKRNPGCSLIYAPTGFGLFFGFLYKFFYRDVKLIFHAHKPFPTKLFQIFFFRQLLNKTDKIIVVSKFLKKNFGRFKTELVYNSIENKSSKNSIKFHLNKKNYHVMMVANNFSYKNYNLFLSVIKKIQKKKYIFIYLDMIQKS